MLKRTFILLLKVIYSVLLFAIVYAGPILLFILLSMVFGFSVLYTLCLLFVSLIVIISSLSKLDSKLKELKREK